MAKGLADIPVRRLEAAQQVALVRLQLFLTGKTHEMLLELGDIFNRELLGASSSAQNVKMEAVKAFSVQQRLEEATRGFVEAFSGFLARMQREAASIPFGALAVRHEGVLQQIAAQSRVSTSSTSETTRNDMLLEARSDVNNYVFTPQLEAILQAANQTIYEDGLNLSGRIWNLEQEMLRGLQETLFQGISDGQSAWEIAKRLQQYLGAGQDCPRWTSTRLYKLSKQQIASGVRTGLKSGGECKEQGVAYKALRLARNEIQRAHHLANDTILAKTPWIEEEQIRLSAGHPAIGCECETVTSGGRIGEGIYPKGTVSLPLHVQCMCYKLTVLMEPEAFAKRLRGWMRGEQAWAEMDQYQTMIGGDLEASLMGLEIGQALVRWLFEPPIQ